MAKYLGSLDDVFTALGDPTRRAMVRALGRGPASVSELARSASMTMPSFMKHVHVLEHWDHVRSLDDPSGYLFVTSLNLYRRRLRRAALALRRSIGVAPTPDAFRAVDDRELILDALAQLPLEQRTALVVTALLGYSSDEAGRLLGVRPSTIRARATRARTALRDLIGEER